ncbi:MAG: hypothetical protein ACFCGT_02305 [Sandaracinaceae bacterium]
MLLGNDRALSYQNVFGARTLGLELSGSWVSPGRYVAVTANTTYVDSRNVSTEGTFGDFAGDRLPSRPYFFANGSLTLQLPKVLSADDSLAAAWQTRYVHGFFRGWESQGLRAFKQTVDAQLVHNLTLTYRLPGPVDVTASFAVHNITDERVFDFFGVQRPGRSFHWWISRAPGRSTPSSTRRRRPSTRSGRGVSISAGRREAT